MCAVPLERDMLGIIPARARNKPRKLTLWTLGSDRSCEVYIADVPQCSHSAQREGERGFVNAALCSRVRLLEWSAKSCTCSIGLVLSVRKLDFRNVRGELTQEYGWTAYELVYTEGELVSVREIVSARRNRKRVASDTQWADSMYLFGGGWREDLFCHGRVTVMLGLTM